MEERQSKGEFFTKFHKLHVKRAAYPGNLLFMNQLDSLRKKWISKKIGLKSPSVYKAKCDLFYHLADSILKVYSNQQYISADFYSYPHATIDVDYVLWLCTIITNVPKNSLPSGYLDKVKEVDLNNKENARKIPGYMSAAYIQNIYTLENFNPEKPYANLENLYAMIKNTRIELIRDRLLSWTIMEYKNKNHPAFDSLLVDFHDDMHE